MDKRAYTDQEAAHALAVLKSNRGNAKKTALQLGIPRTTLRQWADRAYTSTGSPKKVPELLASQAQVDLANKWQKVANLTVDKATSAIEGLDAEKLSANDAYALLKGGGVATDKVQLLSGQPTSRTEAQRVVYVVGNPLRDASMVAIGRTDPAQTPALEGEYVVTQDKEPAL